MHRLHDTTFALLAGTSAILACLLLVAMLGHRASSNDRGPAPGVHPVVAGAEAPPDPATAATATPPAGAQPAPTPPVVATAPVPARPVDPSVRMTVDIPQAMTIRATPRGRVVGTMPANSPYFGTPVRTWVQATTRNGVWGKVSIPWSGNARRVGWVRIDGLHASSTDIVVRASVSRRELVVRKDGRVVLRARVAVGRAGSATPVGNFFVADRVSLGTAHPAYGSYAFGLSGIQTHLPSGWTGGNQLAIHGTDRPSSIGTRASAGCLRVSESTLRVLRPLLQLGTPVIIDA